MLSAEHPNAVNSFTSVSVAQLEAGNYEVESEGERWSMLVVCTLRCRAYFEAGMISRASCAALDHVAKQAMFSCDTELDRWSVLGFLRAKLLSFSQFLFGLGSLSFSIRSEERSGNASKFTHLWLVGRRGNWCQRFLEVLWRGAS